MTHQQQRLLAYLTKRLNEGVCPSYDEMAQALGLASKSSAHRLVTALETRGHVRRLRDRARSIEIIGEHNSIPVDAATYRNALARAAEAGMSLSAYAATAINSMGVRR